MLCVLCAFFVQLCGKKSRDDPDTNRDSLFVPNDVPRPRRGYIPQLSRDDWIRTSGLFVPNEARYRAALHPAVRATSRNNLGRQIYQIK